MQPAEFISMIAPIAVDLRLEGSPIFPSIRIAQAALETGWKIHPWNNLVGFKATSTSQPNAYWKGASIIKPTWEVYGGQRTDTTARFRVYDSIADGFRDQDLLFLFPRYDRVRQANTPEEQAQALRSGGYATDPLYAQKIMNIVRSYGLKRFDEEVDKMKQVIEALSARVAQLEEEVTRLQQREIMPEIPDWALEAVNAAVAADLVDTPNNASYDFYRLLAVMHRKGLI